MKALFYFRNMRIQRRYILDLFFLSIFGLLYWKPFILNRSNSFNVSIPFNGKGFGIDVSHHNGSIDWNKIVHNQEINPSIDFVFLKATEGSNYIDTRFHSNCAALHELGIYKGYYHFFNLVSPSHKQAQFFLETTKGFTGELPPVLDVETDIEKGTALVDSMKVWLEYVEKETGQRPIIYCPWNYFEQQLKEAFPHHKFWVARYGSSIPLSANENILYWQFTDEGTLPYHRTKIDLNVSVFPF